MKIFTDRNLWILLLALIFLRLPTLDRPLSKHHEFNTAVTLTNANSWLQAGGASQFYYTPLMNYQGASNGLLEYGPHVDSLHNHVYLSFGAGAFVLPYIVLKAFHLPFTALWLQLLNILINIITVVMLYRMIFTVTANKHSAIATAALFALMPAPLWYAGNGYVNTTVMMPLVILLLTAWHRFEIGRGNIKYTDLLAFFLSIVALTYFDWLSVFLVGMLVLWALLRAKKSTKYLLVAITGAVGIAAGVFLVLYQFSQYLGWAQVWQYWRSRFAERSTDTHEFSFPAMLVMVARNLVSGYLPLIALLLFAWIKRRSFYGRTHLQWPLWALMAIVPYNGLFFNWSAEHEFAWLAFALMGCVCAGIYFFPFLPALWLKRIIASSVIVSLCIYFIINRPGKISWKGENYAAQHELGKWINSHVDPSLPIFTNLSNDKITEYYAGRTFNEAATVPAAISICSRFNIKKGLWLHIENNKVRHITYINTNIAGR